MLSCLDNWGILILILGFPHANRDDGDKVYTSEEMAKNTNAAKHSPGPAYLYQDQNKYATAPNFGFGTSSKIEPVKAKYDLYENDRFIDDPV